MLVSAVQKAIAPASSSFGPMSWAEAFMMSSLALIAALPVVALLYLGKSALGINLMAGPSPLHDLLYHFVR